MSKVGVLDFVKRQTADSRHDHFDGSWDELVALVRESWERREVSPHNSEVLLVPMPDSIVNRFYSATVEVTPDTPLQAFFAPRAPGEASFIQVSAPGGKKSPAARVEIILYSHEVLARDGDAPPSREADYYIVSVNAYPTGEPQPMSPMTMARNFLDLKGGTRPETPYSAEEFAHSIIYWSTHARLGR